LVGVEFPEPLLDIDELPAEGHDANAMHPIERRRYPRVDPPASLAIHVVHWATVELADVSMSGAMFISATPVEVGRRGCFRARLGDGSFEAEIEARRLARPTARNSRYGIAASFVSMGEESCQRLASFLETAED
jgi:hypothetical protein